MFAGRPELFASTHEEAGFPCTREKLTLLFESYGEHAFKIMPGIGAECEHGFGLCDPIYLEHLIGDELCKFIIAAHPGYSHQIIPAAD